MVLYSYVYYECLKAQAIYVYNYIALHYQQGLFTSSPMQ